VKRNTVGLDRLRQRQRDASERLYAAFDAHNKLPADADDDLIVTVDAELTAAQNAVEAAAEAFDAWRESEDTLKGTES
jgi:hypothetical protein